MSEEFGGDFIVLTDEDGEEFELEHLDTLEHEGTVYMAFIPADQADADEAEIVILKVETEGEDEVLLSVDDESELETVYELFMEKLDPDGDGDDDEDDEDSVEDGE